MKSTRRTETLALRDGALRLAVVADTHSHPHPATARLLAERAPDAILHAGDIGELTVLDQLAEVAPVLAIRGNIDVTTRDAPTDELVLDLVAGERRVFRILMVHIGVAGPRLRSEVLRLAQREQAQLVVCGHSHVPFIGTDRGVGVFNPGSIGPRRFALPIVFGMLEIGATVRMSHVSCETGATWLPP
ncbi:MAG: metallophosphoesterase family protein [Kofleriaceae bacterium]